jgi:hypothetical protein
MKMKKTLLAASLMLGLTAGQSDALTLTFGGQVPTDGSGLTSAVGVDVNNNPLAGYYIETFDVAGSSAQTIAIPGGTISVAAGGGFNSLNPATDLEITNGSSIAIQQGSTVNQAAAPANDTTFFAFGPGPGNNSGSAVSLKVKYADTLSYFQQITGVNHYINYLGMYYGSIDTYNNIAFYSNGSLMQGTGLLADGVLTGTEVLAAMNGYSGNQFLPGSNVYVNMFFDMTDNFDAFEFRTTGVAFEVDNIVAGIAPVPEPSTMMLLGLGLFGMAVYGKRRMDSKKA